MDSGRSHFTNLPEVPPNVVFPDRRMQAFYCLLLIICISTLAFLFARRSNSAHVPLTFLSVFTRSAWDATSFPRLCIAFVLFDSWLFLCVVAFLIFGIGLSASAEVCELAIFSCITFYALSKIGIYVFLVEKVHIVSGHRGTRRSSRIFQFCAVFMTGYIAILVLMIIDKISYVEDNGSCQIGLTPYATIPIVSYDLAINVILTVLFIVPIKRSKFKNPKLEAVARHALVAGMAALTTSAVNVLVLALLHGKELGWVCLSSCCADVTINAIVLFWVTQNPHDDRGGPAELMATRPVLMPDLPTYSSPIHQDKPRMSMAPSLAYNGGQTLSSLEALSIPDQQGEADLNFYIGRAHTVPGEEGSSRSMTEGERVVVARERLPFETCSKSIGMASPAGSKTGQAATGRARGHRHWPFNSLDALARDSGSEAKKREVRTSRRPPSDIKRIEVTTVRTMSYSDVNENLAASSPGSNVLGGDTAEPLGGPYMSSIDVLRATSPHLDPDEAIRKAYFSFDEPR